MGAGWEPYGLGLAGNGSSRLLSTPEVKGGNKAESEAEGGLGRMQ